MVKCRLIDINRYAPFCHGTTKAAVREMQRTGYLSPRGRKRSSVWKGKRLQSKRDRIYFASNHPAGDPTWCETAASVATEREFPGLGWDERNIHKTYLILDKIPAAYAKKVTIDEDCIKYLARKETHGRLSMHPDKSKIPKKCKTGCDSLFVMGTVAVKGKMPLHLFKVLTHDQFEKITEKWYRSHGDE